MKSDRRVAVVTGGAMGIGYAIGGDVVVETIFSWPGLGRTRPAHLYRRLQTATDHRSLHLPEESTAVVVRQLTAARTGGLPLRHAGDR